jgi:ribonuclease R
VSDRFSERILRHLAEPDYRPVKVRRLARLMGIAEEEYGEFRQAVDALRHVGRVALGGGNAVVLPETGRTLIGTFRANPRGFGFVVPENPGSHADLFIPPGAAMDAVTGDTVEATVAHRKGRGGEKMTSGRIVRVISRGNSRFVGELLHQQKEWIVVPDGNRLHVPVFVADVGAKNARAGDQVVVEILTYPTPGRPARGVIVERLGPRGKPGVDLLGIIRQYDLADAFEKDVLAEARQVTRRFDLDKVLAEREDLRDETIITIDPDDARDFDDAISLQRSDDGWELGVHIADVSHFVRFDTALDAEARNRGNSIYFPRHVLPMLPEVLSNGLCSLQQDEPRLCKSAYIRFDAEGRVRGSRVANTVIRSVRRLTYREAQAIIDGKTGGVPRKIVALLKEMDALARAIRQRRLDEGMIVLDLPEIDLIFDDEQRVADAAPTDASFTHTIIEMFMVEANEAVARLLTQAGVPFLRRIHPEPDQESGDTLRTFLRVAGHRLPTRLNRDDLRRLLDSVRGKPEAYALHLAVLKSLEQAVYSPKAEGHYALASDCYTHFTSPIRRYTDLTIHRLVQRMIEAGLTEPARLRRRGRRTAADIGENVDDLRALGRHLSFTERRAADAEREYKTLKILELLARHVGDHFEGVVTGVTNFGLFVQHPRFLLDGLVGFQEMPDDRWEVDTRTGSVIGRRTRRRYEIGDVVAVQIVAVDLGSRQLNLRMVRVVTPRRATTATETSPTTKPRQPRKAAPRRRGRR